MDDPTASGQKNGSPGLLRRVLSFGGLPFLALLTPFLFLPILARVAGADAWLAIAVGQSVGAFLALFVALGYNTVGPTLVALAQTEEKPTVLRQSVLARLAILAPALIVGTALAALIAPDSHRIEAALMSAAMVLTGFSSAWYMIGLGRAELIVLYEMLPRILATAAAAAVLLLYAQVLWYPVLLIAAAVRSSTLFLSRTVGLRELLRTRPGELRATLRANRSAMSTEIVGGAYNSLAVTFVSLTAPAAHAANYVSGDKLYRIGQYSVSALGNALQGWVVEDDRAQFTQRARKALVLHLTLGLVGLAGFALLGPPLSGALFGDVVAIDTATSLGFGIATLGIALGTAVGRVILIGLGARREFLISVILGATAGVPSIFLLAAAFGAAGGAWGLAIGEITSVIAQSIFAWRRWSQWADEPRMSATNLD
ncbi:MAG TPA: polysaccharide biosynthesis protein [Terrimesophilobacter sp.]|nr:polysaccharide biosynthesis protein [Terrimesophilobacter sp.]